MYVGRDICFFSSRDVWWTWRAYIVRTYVGYLSSKICPTYILLGFSAQLKMGKNFVHEFSPYNELWTFIVWAWWDVYVPVSFRFQSLASFRYFQFKSWYLFSNMTINISLNTKIAFSFHQFISKQRRLWMIIWKWNIHRIKIVFLKSSKYIHIYRLSFHPGFCLSLHFGKVNCFFSVVPVIFLDFWKCNFLIHSIVNIGKKYEKN